MAYGLPLPIHDQLGLANDPYVLPHPFLQVAIRHLRLTSPILDPDFLSEHIELPAKLLDYFLQRNNSNINQNLSRIKPCRRKKKEHASALP